MLYYGLIPFVPFIYIRYIAVSYTHLDVYKRQIIGLFVLFMFRVIAIGERARNAFTRVYAYGFLGFLIIHFFINIGMTIGLMPVIGVPLPFVSYGGTSCIVFSIMTAVLLKLDTSRHFV